MKKIALAFLTLTITMSACKGDEHSRNRKDQEIDRSDIGVDSDVDPGGDADLNSDSDAEIAPLPNDIGATDLDVVPCDCLDSDRAIICECFDFQIADAYDLNDHNPFGD